MVPQLDRRGVVQADVALLRQDAQQGGRDALAHRPAFQLGVLVGAFTVPFTDDLSLVDGNERCGQAVALERGIDGCANLRPVKADRPGVVRHDVAHRPRLRHRVGQRGLDGCRLEQHVVVSRWDDDAPLVAEVLRPAGEIVEGDVDGSGRPVQHNPLIRLVIHVQRELLPIGHREVRAAVPQPFLEVAFRDEDGGAEDLGEAHDPEVVEGAGLLRPDMTGAHEQANRQGDW